jgi:N-hydroxyarylamine O-acetyltransferase
MQQAAEAPLDPLLDLPAYLARIGHSGPLTPDLASLAALHVAHSSSIPFENLAIQLGQGIRLDLPALQAKLVAGGRGGYCFEHNSLFAAALRGLGFQVRLREARVRRGATTRLARTHLVLEVAIAGEAWLADVGFGGDGILGPVPLDGRVQERFGDRHRVLPEGARQVLQTWTEGAWTDLYALEPSEVFPVDLELANHWTSTHPESRVVQTLTAQRCAPGRRSFLRNLAFTVVRGQVSEGRTLDRGELLQVLAAEFGLGFAAGTRFRALDG